MILCNDELMFIAVKFNIQQNHALFLSLINSYRSKVKVTLKVSEEVTESLNLQPLEELSDT